MIDFTINHITFSLHLVPMRIVNRNIFQQLLSLFLFIYLWLLQFGNSLLLVIIYYTSFLIKIGKFEGNQGWKAAKNKIIKVWRFGVRKKKKNNDVGENIKIARRKKKGKSNG